MMKHVSIGGGRRASESVRDHQEPWDWVCQQYYQVVRRYFTVWPVSPDDVDDLVQNVFANLVKHRYLPEDPRPYIRVAAWNQLRSYLRQRKRIDRQAASRALRRDDITATMLLAIDPCEQLCEGDEQRVVKRAVKNLPAPLARALRLRIVEGLPLREAAKKAGCSREVMKKRLQRAKRCLLESYRQMSEPDAHCRT